MKILLEFGEIEMKYKDWLDEWLNNYVKIANKRRTFDQYSTIVRVHINPKLGNSEIGALTRIELQKFVTELLLFGNKATGRGLSTSTVNSVITVVQNSLRTAFDLGLVSSNLANSIKRPKTAEKRIECFTVEEQRMIEKAVLSDDKHPYMYGIVLCLYTGLRIGELLALTWDDIDFASGMLFVTKTCYDCKSESGEFMRIIDSPKTSTSCREIPLPKQIIPILKRMKKIGGANCIISKKSKPISVRTYQRNFESLLKDLCIPYRSFHALRHTFATRAIECGMDVKTLSEILGHKNASMTLNRYAHSLLEHKKDMMNRLGKLCKCDAH